MRLWAALAAILLAHACADEPAALLPDVGAIDAGFSAPDASCDAEPCSLPPVHCAQPPGLFETVESSCDGVDNDCDGLVDLLLPIEENACSTAALGVCGRGHFACLPSGRACVAPAPTPEVSNGLDDDCDGTVDEPAGRAVSPRLLVLVPEYLWDEAPSELATMTEVLRSWGLPFDYSAPKAPLSAALPSLSRYSAVLIPGYLLGGFVGAREAEALLAFARAGGVVAVVRPIGSSTSTGAIALAGLLESERRFDIRVLDIGERRPPAFADFDSPEELAVPVTDNVRLNPIEVYALTPDPAIPGVEVVATGRTATATVPIITRRSVGQGAIYALGHDLMLFDQSRCYVNCFEPGRDLLGLFARGAVHEGAGGHSVFLHTLPGLERSALFLTHDVDAPDAQEDGRWGRPGAVRMSEVEARHGARGTYYVTTDYAAGYYRPEILPEICRNGGCPLGAHSVRHASDFDVQPHGSCQETSADYLRTSTLAGSLCGEIRVSKELLTAATQRPPVVWRSPYLYVHPDLYDVLAANGFISDSSFAIGDFKMSLPFSLERVGFGQAIFHHQPIYESLISIEDGIGFYDAAGVERRIELQADNFWRFHDQWRYILLQHAANRTVAVALIHPSYGLGVGPENLAIKLAAADRLLANATAAGIKTDLVMEEYIRFWQGRAEVRLEASFAPDSGYSGTIRTGSVAVSGLVLELGGVLREGRVGAHPVRLSGSRLLVEDEIPARTTVGFEAR